MLDRCPQVLLRLPTGVAGVGDRRHRGQVVCVGGAARGGGAGGGGGAAAPLEFGQRLGGNESTMQAPHSTFFYTSLGLEVGSGMLSSTVHLATSFLDNAQTSNDVFVQLVGMGQGRPTRFWPGADCPREPAWM
eukprot:COSAG04_NODE_235_length_19140_cov_47.925109_6_plen_133_part_00